MSVVRQPGACPYCLRAAARRADHIECQEHGRWTLDGEFYAGDSGDTVADL